MVEILIEKGVDIHAKSEDGEVAMFGAALNSNVKVAELLIKAGAPVNAVGKNGWTPLFLTVFNGTFNTILHFNTELQSDQKKN